MSSVQVPAAQCEKVPGIRFVAAEVADAQALSLPAALAFVPLPSDTRSASRSLPPRDGTAPPAPRDSSRRPEPRHALHSARPSPAPARCSCASRRAESAAAPATRAVERQSLAGRALRAGRDFRTRSDPSRTLCSAASTSRDSEGSRRNSAAGNSARRLASASAAVPPARASTARVRSLRQSLDQKVNVRSTSQSARLCRPWQTRRRHAQLSSFIRPARRAKSGLVDRIGHAPVLLQRSAQPAGPQRSLILQRAHAHLLLEQPLHRERTHARNAPQFRERTPRGRGLPLDEHVSFSKGLRRRSWLAAFAGAKPRGPAPRSSSRRTAHSHAAAAGSCTPACRTRPSSSPHRKIARCYRARRAAAMHHSRRMPSLPDPQLRIEHCSSWNHRRTRCDSLHSDSCAQFNKYSSKSQGSLLALAAHQHRFRPLQILFGIHADRVRRRIRHIDLDPRFQQPQLLQLLHGLQPTGGSSANRSSAAFDTHRSPGACDSPQIPPDRDQRESSPAKSTAPAHPVPSPPSPHSGYRNRPPGSARPGSRPPPRAGQTIRSAAEKTPASASARRPGC